MLDAQSCLRTWRLCIFRNQLSSLNLYIYIYLYCNYVYLLYQNRLAVFQICYTQCKFITPQILDILVVCVLFQLLFVFAALSFVSSGAFPVCGHDCPQLEIYLPQPHASLGAISTINIQHDISSTFLCGFTNMLKCCYYVYYVSFIAVWCWGENMLMSEGFTNARLLAHKFALCSGQQSLVN